MPARRRPPRRCARSSRPPSARACCCASTPRRRASTASRPRDGLVLDAPLSDDVELCVVARRRRHHPARAAPLRGHERARSSPSTTARSASSPPSTPTRTATCRRLRARAGRRLRGPDAAGARAGDARRARRRRSTTSRSIAAPASASRSSPTRSTARRRARCAATASCSSTPAGSTGYNLANGGPVLAWGVEGFVVSFIAPHSLTARALVVAPERPAVGPQPLAGRGRHLARRAPRRRSSAPATPISASFLREAADLAQVPGSSFYRRLRQKFGRLAS